MWTNQRPGSPASGEAEGGCGELRGQSLVSGPASVVVRPGEDEEEGEGPGEVEAARNLLASGQEKVNKSTVTCLMPSSIQAFYDFEVLNEICQANSSS